MLYISLLRDIVVKHCWNSSDLGEKGKSENSKSKTPTAQPPKSVSIEIQSIKLIIARAVRNDSNCYWFWDEIWYGWARLKNLVSFRIKLVEKSTARLTRRPNARKNVRCWGILNNNYTTWGSTTTIFSSFTPPHRQKTVKIAIICFFLQSDIVQKLQHFWTNLGA